MVTSSLRVIARALTAVSDNGGETGNEDLRMPWDSWGFDLRVPQGRHRFQNGWTPRIDNHTDGNTSRWADK